MKPQTEEQWLMVLAVIERLYAEVRAGNWDGLRQMLHGYATSPPEPSVKPMPYTSHREALQDIADAYAARSELFTNDADCAANLADRARAGLRLSAEPRDKAAQRHANKVLLDAMSIRDHFTHCDRTMGDSHACTCGMDAYGKLLRELNSSSTKAGDV